MQVVRDINSVRRAVAAARAAGQRIGCIPTMGALHAGHLSLVAACRERSEFVVVTIFVNPTQFAPHEDLSRYPRPLETDLTKCRDAGADLVFVPEVGELYPPGFETFVEVQRLAQVLEGAARPGHFRGVATVVLKLFQIVQPDVACFGQKDFQQQLVVRRMIRDLDLPVELVVCPTVREPDGLAMSSRNVFLSEAERRLARSLSESLELAGRMCAAGEPDLHRVREAMRKHLQSFPGVAVDYATVADAETLEEPTAVPADRAARRPLVALVAARVGQTRLIDNQLLEIR